jgi:hypothetical protein
LLVKTVGRLAQLSCWRLQYGGQPADVARSLAEFLQQEDARTRSRDRADDRQDSD